MQGSPPRISSLISSYPHLLSLPLGSSPDATPELSRELLPVLEALVQDGDVAVAPGEVPLPVTGIKSEDAATGWSEFWSLPSVAESLSLAIKTPLPASYSMSFLAPHLSHLGLSHTPLRVVVSDGVKKRVSTPSAVSNADDADRSIKASRNSRNSPLKRSLNNSDSGSPSKTQKLSCEKGDAADMSEAAAAAPPPTPRPPTPRGSFTSTVSPTPLTIQQLNNYCGVTVPNGWCLHAVDSCRLHNEKTRRSVLGRGCEFDSILARCAARRSFHDFTMTELWKSGGLCNVPYPHSPYPAIVGGSRSGLGIDAEDDKNVASDSRVVLFGGKKCDDFDMETIGGLKPKYNFKAPFDRYQPVVVRNIMSDLFRVSSDPLYLPLRRPCVPFVKPPPVPVTTPQVPSGGTPVSTPRSATPKGAAGMQASASFSAPQSQPPNASPRAPSLPPPSSAANAPSSSPSLSTAPQTLQRSSSKSSKASTPNAAAGNTNVGSSSAGAKFADAASTPGAKSAANATSSVKAGSASSGPGTSSIASHSSSIAVNSASSAATGNAQLQSAKPSGFGPSNGAAAQGPPYNTSAATSNVSLGANSSASTPTAGSSTTTPRSSFNAADGSRGATASTQSAAATGSGGNTSRSSKNNAAAQAIAETSSGAEIPEHNSAVLTGMRYQQDFAHVFQKILCHPLGSSSGDNHCIYHLQERLRTRACQRHRPPSVQPTQLVRFAVSVCVELLNVPRCNTVGMYNNTPCIIETQIITATGTRFLVYADLRCLNCHQVSFLYDKATNDRARADQSKQAAAQAAAAATALVSGSGTPSSATKAANRRAAAKNAKAAAAGTASPAAASNSAVGSTVPTSAGISTSASTSMPTATATTAPSTAVSQPSQTQAAAPGPATAAPKAKSRSKVQIDYSLEPSATYLAQLQASSNSGALPASTAGSTPKTKATAGQMAVTNLPAARNVVLATPYPPGSAPQPSLQPGVASPNINQPMGHPNMIPAHPHYAPNSQPHFGVATAVYNPSANAGFYAGGVAPNGPQGQYAGAGLSGVGASTAPQNQMQFGAQTLSTTLSQTPAFASFPNAHALPPPPSSLVQAGVGASGGQFLSGASLDGMPSYPSSPSHAPIQQFHYNMNVGSLGGNAAVLGAGADMGALQGGQNMPQVISLPAQQQLSLQQQHDQQQHLQHVPLVQQQLLQQQQHQSMHPLPQEMQQAYSQQQSQQHMFQQQQHNHQQMLHTQQQPAPYPPQSTPTS